jgi:hypothetical protein
VEKVPVFGGTVGSVRTVMIPLIDLQIAEVGEPLVDPGTIYRCHMWI